MQLPSVLRLAKQIDDWIIDRRRQLHRFPELMYEEVRTSQLVRDTLDGLGVSYRYPLAETGVVATIGNGNGPCVALRADMDALPIHEEADVSFTSEIDGKMHACGHDCHTAMLLGAARILKENEDTLNGTVKLLFQPAEEGGAGGLRMCNEGALEDPSVQRVFGIHVWPQLPTGTIGACEGTFLAAAGSLKISIHGTSGHAAMPHFAVDPVTTSAKVINELQTIVSRETDPLSSAVISITTIHAGEAYNVIPETVELTGTIRALTLDTLELLQSRVKDITQSIATANRCTVDIEFPGHDYPPTVNDSEAWNLAKEVGNELLGDGQVHEILPVMGGEDFAFYCQKVPGCFVGLGIQNESAGAIYSVHNSRFKVDENALHFGTAMHVAYALRALAELQSTQ